VSSCSSIARPVRSRLALWTAAALVALAVIVPRIALACSVCMSGRDDETRAAFLATTGLLSLLPLSMVGGLVWWLRRRARELERAEAGSAASLETLSRTSSLR
jgi:hypothetical protein